MKVFTALLFAVLVVVISAGSIPKLPPEHKKFIEECLKIRQPAEKPCFTEEELLSLPFDEAKAKVHGCLMTYDCTAPFPNYFSQYKVQDKTAEQMVAFQLRVQESILGGKLLTVPEAKDILNVVVTTGTATGTNDMTEEESHIMHCLTVYAMCMVLLENIKSKLNDKSINVDPEVNVQLLHYVAPQSQSSTLIKSVNDRLLRRLQFYREEKEILAKAITSFSSGNPPFYTLFNLADADSDCSNIFYFNCRALVTGAKKSNVMTRDLNILQNFLKMEEVKKSLEAVKHDSSRPLVPFDENQVSLAEAFETLFGSAERQGLKSMLLSYPKKEMIGVMKEMLLSDFSKVYPSIGFLLPSFKRFSLPKLMHMQSYIKHLLVSNNPLTLTNVEAISGVTFEDFSKKTNTYLSIETKELLAASLKTLNFKDLNKLQLLQLKLWKSCTSDVGVLKNGIPSDIFAGSIDSEALDSDVYYDNLRDEVLSSRGVFVDRPNPEAEAILHSWESEPVVIDVDNTTKPEITQQSVPEDSKDPQVQTIKPVDPSLDDQEKGLQINVQTTALPGNVDGDSKDETKPKHPGVNNDPADLDVQTAKVKNNSKNRSKETKVHTDPKDLVKQNGANNNPSVDKQLQNKAKGSVSTKSTTKQLGSGNQPASKKSTLNYVVIVAVVLVSALVALFIVMLLQHRRQQSEPASLGNKA